MAGQEFFGHTPRADDFLLIIHGVILAIFHGEYPSSEWPPTPSPSPDMPGWVLVLGAFAGVFFAIGVWQFRFE